MIESLINRLEPLTVKVAGISAESAPETYLAVWSKSAALQRLSNAALVDVVYLAQMVDEYVSSGEVLATFLHFKTILLGHLFPASPALMVKVPGIFVSLPVVFAAEFLGAVREGTAVRAFVTDFMFPTRVSGHSIC